MKKSSYMTPEEKKLFFMGFCYGIGALIFIQLIIQAIKEIIING